MPELLTEVQRKAFLHRAEEFGQSWRDHASALIKWLLGTLITVNAGGMFFAASANVHPDALITVYVLFFVGMALDLLTSATEVARVQRLSNLAFALKAGLPSAKTLTSGDIDKLFSFRTKSIPAILCFISVVSFFFAGFQLASSTIPCSVAQLEVSKEIGHNVSGGRAPSKTCYFYEVEGFSNDPLERAIQEQEMIQKLRVLEGTSTAPPLN